MKKATLFAAALVSAVLFTAGLASAVSPTGYSAGLSPNLVNPLPDNRKANPQPVLAVDANRLIRWQGWLDVDAFAASLLEQMQEMVNDGTIPLGTYTVEEPSIGAAVLKAKMGGCDVVTTCASRCCFGSTVKKCTPGLPGFEMNPNLEPGGPGESFNGCVKVYVWTYRHNYTDKGRYQLYISVRGEMEIGTVCVPPGDEPPPPHRDIQSLNYEFGPGFYGESRYYPPRPLFAEVEIWRGAVVAVDTDGRLTDCFDANGVARTAVTVPGVATYDAGVEMIDYAGNPLPPLAVQPPLPVPAVSVWELAPSLIGNPTYKPLSATGPRYAHPADHTIQVKKLAGDVQQERRVRTVPIIRRAAAGYR